MTTWDVWSVEMLGNARDGWDFNDRRPCGTVEIPDGADPDDVRNALRHQLLIKRGTHSRSIGVTWDEEDRIEITDERKPRLFADPARNSYGWGKPAYILNKQP